MYMLESDYRTERRRMEVMLQMCGWVPHPHDQSGNIWVPPHDSSTQRFRYSISMRDLKWKELHTSHAFVAVCRTYNNDSSSRDERFYNFNDVKRWLQAWLQKNNSSDC